MPLAIALMPVEGTDGGAEVDAVLGTRAEGMVTRSASPQTSGEASLKGDPQGLPIHGLAISPMHAEVDALVRYPVIRRPARPAR